MPPLRARVDDVPRLARHFLEELRGTKPIEGFSRAAMECLVCYSWPGNVRELKNAVEHGVALCRAKETQLEDLPDTLRRNSGRDSTVTLSLDGRERVDMPKVIGDAERELVLWAMDKAAGNQNRAAELLSVPRTTLQSKLARLNAGGSGAEDTAAEDGASAAALDAS